MKRFLFTLAIASSLLFISSASSNDTLYAHWPRYTTGPAQISVVPSTDISVTINPAYAQWLSLAVSNINLSSKVHLNLKPPGPCINVLGQICVIGVSYPTNGFWGWTNLVYQKYNSALLWYAQVSINQAHVDPANDWASAYIFCHEMLEAVGLPDPSDDPVTPTVEPTCLTRDGSMAISYPSDWNYKQLDTLYTNIDPPPPPPTTCTRKRCK